MTEQEFQSRWGGVDVDALSENELRQYKQDCFALYETTGFLERFDSPYDEEDGPRHHNGMRFEVVRRAREWDPDASSEEGDGDADLETLPLWLVRFANGDEAFCYPEEIAVIEHRDKTYTKPRTIPGILYRTESYSGSGVRNLSEIIYYEMAELRNKDIPKYILGHYDLTPELRKALLDTVALEDGYPFLFDRGTFEDLVEAVVTALCFETGKDLGYGLWLATKEAAEDTYSADGETPSAYRTSGVILSDLGRDGLLFAYEEPPRPETGHVTSKGLERPDTK